MAEPAGVGTFQLPVVFLLTHSPPRPSYKVRLHYEHLLPELVHIDEGCKRGRRTSARYQAGSGSGGYAEALELTVSYGHKVTTGFSHGAVLGIADKVIDAVKRALSSTSFCCWWLRRRSPWS